MLSRVCAVAGTLLVALAAPAGAQAAPTIEPLKPCYVTAGTARKPQAEGVELRAQVFTANSKVDLTVNGAPIKHSTGLQVDDAGILVLDDEFEFPAPFVRKDSQAFTVTLTEQNNSANTVTATAMSTHLDVRIRPQSARPSDRIHFGGLGFTADRPIYAHYTQHGKQVRRVRMARRPGDCGHFSVRRRQFPMKHPDQGTWWVQFDQSRKYVDGRKGAPRALVRVKFVISLVPR